MVLKSAVVGAGVIALEHLPFLSESDRCELVGVCDLSEAGSQIIGRKFGCGSTFTDLAEMLKGAQPDVVHVLTPPHTHGALVRMCLESGTSVICEKPLAPTAKECRELFDLAERKGVHLVEVHNYRFNDGSQALFELIESGQLGTVHEVEVRMGLPVRAAGGRFSDLSNPNPIHSMPAGVVHDVITHMAYLTNRFAGDPEWRTASSMWSNLGGGDLFKVDDLDSILLGYSHGNPVHCRLRFAANLSPDEFLIRVHGSEGRAETNLFHPHLKVDIERPVGEQLTPIANHVLNGFALMRSGVSNLGQKLVQHSPYHGLARFLDETYAALASGSTGPVTRSDVVLAAELVDLLVSGQNGMGE